MQRNDLKILATQSKDRLDAAFQTEVLERTDESCQTETPERKDFQVQACIRQQSEPIAIQTDTSKCDFQVQANIPPESCSLAVQTIKEEIAMPNIPSSNAQAPAKKRKLSSINAPSSLQSAPRCEQAIDVEPAGSDFSAPQSIANGSGDQQEAIDDAILNSEVYKIYSRNKDTKEAMKQIKELKTCVSIEEPTRPFPVENLNQCFQKTLKELWKIESHCGDSKFTKIKKYVGEYSPYRIYYEIMHKDTRDLFQSCLTQIRMMNPNGYEFWYVANFEKGPGLSKWYRAESFKWDAARRLAQLNVMGITKEAIKELQLDHNLKKNSRKVPCFDLAFAIVNNDLREITRSFFPACAWPSSTFDVEEVKTNTETLTLEVNASFRIRYRVGYDSDYDPILENITYHGKSTRPMKRTRQPKNEKEIMEKEAKKAALMEFFKERFGLTEFNDLCVDELHRPMIR